MHVLHKVNTKKDQEYIKNSHKSMRKHIFIESGERDRHFTEEKLDIASKHING